MGFGTADFLSSFFSHEMGVLVNGIFDKGLKGDQFVSSRVDLGTDDD